MNRGAVTTDKSQIMGNQKITSYSSIVPLPSRCNDEIVYLVKHAFWICCQTLMKLRRSVNTPSFSNNFSKILPGFQETTLMSLFVTFFSLHWNLVCLVVHNSTNAPQLVGHALVLWKKSFKSRFCLPENRKKSLSNTSTSPLLQLPPIAKGRRFKDSSVAKSQAMEPG